MRKQGKRVLAIHFFLIRFLTQDGTRIVCTIRSNKFLSCDWTCTKIQISSQSSCHSLLMSHIVMHTRKRKFHLTIDLQFLFDNTKWPPCRRTDDHTINDSIMYCSRICIHSYTRDGNSISRNIDSNLLLISYISSQESLFFAKRIPWHCIGLIISEETNPCREVFSPLSSLLHSCNYLRHQ